MNAFESQSGITMPEAIEWLASSLEVLIECHRQQHANFVSCFPNRPSPYAILLPKMKEMDGCIARCREVCAQTPEYVLVNEKDFEHMKATLLQIETSPPPTPEEWHRVNNKLDDFRSRTITPIYGLAAYGTPGKFLGTKCVICREEARERQSITHTPDCPNYEIP